jgi:hypothetical protein
MTRTTISLPVQLLWRLKVIAAERGVSMAELVRKTLEERVAENRPRPRLGVFESDPNLPPIDHEAPVPPARSYDHIMGRGKWAVDSRLPDARRHEG